MSRYFRNDASQHVNDWIAGSIRMEYVGGAGDPLIVDAFDGSVEVPARQIDDRFLVWLCADGPVTQGSIRAGGVRFEVHPVGTEPTANYKRAVTGWTTLNDSPALMRQVVNDNIIQFNKDYPYMPLGETMLQTGGLWRQYQARGMWIPGYAAAFYCRLEGMRVTGAGHAQANVSCDNDLVDGEPVSGEGNFAFRMQSKGYTELNQPEVYDDMVRCVVPPGPNEGTFFIHTNSDSSMRLHGSGWEFREAPGPHVLPEPPPPGPGEHPGGWITGSVETRFGNLNNNVGAWHDGVSNVPIGGPNPAAALRTNATSLFFGAAIVPSGRIKRFEITGSNNDGYVSNATPQVTIKCYGKVGSQPTGPGDCMLLGTMPPFTDTANESAWRGLDTSDQTYFDHFAYEVIQGGGAANMAIGEARVEIRAG